MSEPQFPLRQIVIPPIQQLLDYELAARPWIRRVSNPFLARFVAGFFGRMVSRKYDTAIAFSRNRDALNRLHAKIEEKAARG